MPRLTDQESRSDGENMTENIIRAILAEYPDAQAVYLYGSFGTQDQRDDSDVDLALLLPPEKAKAAKSLALSGLRSIVENLLHREVDLVNLRLVSTVLQKEVVMTGRRIYTGDEYAAEEFEMLTLSFYQKLNEERAEILTEGLRSGRFYDV